MNKKISQANATSNEASDASNSSGSTGLSQEKMDQLIFLLQQTNLFTSVPASTSDPTTNHISVSPQVSSNYTAASSSVGNLNTHSCFFPSTSHWLLHSGGNEHIYGNLASFTSFYQIKHVHVNLPNGTSILVNHDDIVSFSSQLYLTNALYSPSFKLNHIYVAKLCHSLSCFVQFSHTQCIIHDQFSMKQIDLAKQVDGLYILHSLSLVSASDLSSHINKFVMQFLQFLVIQVLLLFPIKPYCTSDWDTYLIKE